MTIIMDDPIQKLKAELDECRDSLDAVAADSSVGAEDAVKQSIIEPLLDELGWRNRTKRREYRIGTGKADYALLNKGLTPVALIEAKRRGNLNAKGENQLFEYALKQFFKSSTEVLLVLTDGQKWVFYLTWKKGIQQIADLQFYAFDLEKDDTGDIAVKLDAFLRRERVLSGAAQESAEEEWKFFRERKKLRESLPEILKVLLQNLPANWAQDVAAKVKENLNLDFSPGDIRSEVGDLKIHIGDLHLPPDNKREDVPPPPSGDLVVRYNGVLYQGAKASVVFADVIAAFGVRKVYQLCREKNITMVGHHVVIDTNVFPKFKTGRKVNYQDRDGYRVVTHSQTEDKKTKLSEIAAALGLKITFG